MNGLDMTRTGLSCANRFQELYEDQNGNRFMLLLWHDNKQGAQLFTSSNATRNEEPGLFSRIYLLESAPALFQTDGKFEFIALMPDDNDLIYRWTQTSNPMTTTSVSGFTNISNSTAGLSKYNSNTYLRTQATWWGAVGCWTAYTQGGRRGIPGFGGNSDANVCTGLMLLYAKINEKAVWEFPTLLLVHEFQEY